MSQRALIIFPGALGDLICLAPTIAAIARRHPGADIELMARYELAEFAVGRLGIATAHSIDRREVAMLFAHDAERARSFFRQFARIYCFFNAGDPQFRDTLTKASALDATSFHPFRPPTDGHVAAAYLREVTGSIAVDRVSISLLPRDVEEAALALAGISAPVKFVAIFPGSGSPSKNWPIDRFSELAVRLRARTPTIFILGPAEATHERILRGAGHFVIKDRSLEVVAAIAQMASAFIGNDSGVSHLAAATGTAGLVLFGNTDPARWRPLGEVTVVQRDPIDSIELDEVLAAKAGLDIGS